MPEKPEKPKLTRAILESHGIYYHEEFYLGNSTTPKPSMPDHVNKLREALLSLSGIQIPDDWKTFFRDEETHPQASELDLQPPKSAFLTDERLRRWGPDWRTVKEKLDYNIYVSMKIANEARKLHIDAESGWMDFLKAKFFKRFEHQQDENNDDRLQFDDFSLEENVLWDQSKLAFQLAENLTPGIRERTGPKPDLSYGFKASQLGNNQRGFEGMHYFRNLSFEVLGELLARTPAIQSTVTTGLSRWQLWRAANRNESDSSPFPGKLLSPDFLCFPWAVVEVKHGQVNMSNEEFCQCQLANATACAYDIREKLIRSVDESGPVDPIIGFTCIGPEVRLWLTYRGNDSKMHMVCIWSTSFDSVWGALRLTAVIDRMQMWASWILRGKIVQYIDWAYRAVASTTPNDMRNPSKGPGAPVVDCKVRTSSTKGIFASGALSGKGVTIDATWATSTPAEAIPKRKIQVEVPAAPDSNASAANESNGSKILTRAAGAASNTFINQQAIPATGGRTAPSNGIGTVPASTLERNQSSTITNGPTVPWPKHPFDTSTITNGPTAPSPKNPFGTPATSVFGKPLGNAPSKVEGFATSSLSTTARKPITTQPFCTRPGGSADTANNASSSSSKTPSSSLFNFNGLSSALPCFKETAPPAATLTRATLQHEPAPAHTTLPLKASNATPASGPFFAPGLSFQSNPQRSTLSPPQEPLRSSRSDTNLAAKAKSPASTPKYTLFDKLAQTPDSGVSIFASLRGISGQAKDKA